MTRSGGEIGAGLAPARAPQPIRPGERIHVVGAAGAGASAAAQLAHAAGAHVTGCDAGGPSPYTASFSALGIELAGAHDAGHVAGEEGPLVDRLAVTKALTAVQPDHPELLAARAAGLPVEAWQQVIADAAASQGGRFVAVAGTHGKSTSSGWLVHVLVQAGLDPAAFVGALMPAADAGGRAGTSRWGLGDAFVVEADEYAGNFDPYRPEVAIVLNAEWDHPDVFADERAVLDAFEAWLRAPGVERRRIVVNVSDPGGAALVGRLSDLGEAVVGVALLHGRDGGAGSAVARALVRGRLQGAELHLDGVPVVGGPRSLRVRLPLAGRHNAANATCVATVAALLGVPGEVIATGLASFPGVGRRLELKGEPRGVIVLDDYAHHPTAIRATLAAVRGRHPGRRLWAVHEPLTYHRTAAMLDALADALAAADEAVVVDIWAGRDPDTTIASATGVAAAVAARTGRKVAAPGSPEATAEWLAGHVAPGDVVVVMGGGRSYVVSERLVALLADVADR